MSDILSDAHRRTLKETSGLTDAVIDARGYKTLSEAEFSVAVAQGLYRPELLAAEGWMAIPVIRPDGVKHCDIIRLDNTVKGFKNQKYIWPTGLRNAIDISPFTAQYITDNAVPLLVTEGVKKGDAIASHIISSASITAACVAAINGCWGWRAKMDGVSIANPDVMDIGLNDRQAIFIVDSDYYLNDDVKAGWDGFLTYMASKVHKVFLCVVPMQGLKKQGADDYLLEHSLDDLLSYCRTPAQAQLSYTVPSLDIVSGKEIMDTSSENISWLVDKLIPEASITVMAGHTTTFKTWHALRLCFDLMLGQPFLGHEDFAVDAPASTLYVNREMGRSMLGSRMHNYALAPSFHNMKVFDEAMQSSFFGLDSPLFDIMDSQTQKLLIDYIQQNNIKLTVLDTFSMVWDGDENSSKEVASFYNTLRYITSETGCSFLLIHHLTKPTRDRAGFDQLFAVRGSGQIIQQADSAFTLNVYDTNETDTRIKIINAKNRVAYTHPAFLTQFHSDPNSWARELLFDSLLSEDRAHAAITGGEEGVRTWLLTMCGDHTTMINGPGLSADNILAFVDLNWPIDGSKKPTGTKMRKILADLVREQIFILDSGHYTFAPNAEELVLNKDKEEVNE